MGSWLETKSFHGVEKIAAALRYIGVTMDDAAMPGDWRKMLNEYTEQRHKIVHRANKARSPGNVRNNGPI